MKYSIYFDGDYELVVDIPIIVVDSSTLDNVLSDLADTCTLFKKIMTA
jgi:hypothetical protein